MDVTKRITDDRSHRRNRQRFFQEQGILHRRAGAIGLGLLKEFSASVTGNTDVAGYGAPETTSLRASPEFWLAHGEPGAMPIHVAFRVSSRTLVDAFYNAAVAAGGRDNGAPGLRPQYQPNYYGAFVLDPDGHNIEAVCRVPA